MHNVVVSRLIGVFGNAAAGYDTNEELISVEYCPYGVIGCFSKLEKICNCVEFGKVCTRFLKNTRLDLFYLRFMFLYSEGLILYFCLNAVAK